MRRSPVASRCLVDLLVTRYVTSLILPLSAPSFRFASATRPGRVQSSTSHWLKQGDDPSNNYSDSYRICENGMALHMVALRSHEGWCWTPFFRSGSRSTSLCSCQARIPDASAHLINRKPVSRLIRRLELSRCYLSR